MGVLTQRFKTLREAYTNNTYRDLDMYKKGSTIVQRMMDDRYQEQYAPKEDPSPSVVYKTAAAPAPTLEDNSPDAESSEAKKTLRRRKGKTGLMVSGGGSGNTGINL